MILALPLVMCLTQYISHPDLSGREFKGLYRYREVMLDGCKLDGFILILNLLFLSIKADCCLWFTQDPAGSSLFGLYKHVKPTKRESITKGAKR